MGVFHVVLNCTNGTKSHNDHKCASSGYYLTKAVSYETVVACHSLLAESCNGIKYFAWLLFKGRQLGERYNTKAKYIRNKSTH